VELHQSNIIPTDEELVNAGAYTLSDFLGCVGTTVTHGVIQAAPTILTAVTNSMKANDTLASSLPVEVSFSSVSFNEMDIAARISVASRIVNGAPNWPSLFETDTVVDDVAVHLCTLGAQATFDTFTASSIPQEQRSRFRNMAIEVANSSSTLSNAVNTMNFGSYATSTNVSGCVTRTLDVH
jgi:hypothetical protein